MFSFFKKKCVYCGKEIDEEPIKRKVKVPEFKSKVKKNFCSEEHAKNYKEEVNGTPRKSYCPSCAI